MTEQNFALRVGMIVRADPWLQGGGEELQEIVRASERNVVEVRLDRTRRREIVRAAQRIEKRMAGIADADDDRGVEFLEFAHLGDFDGSAIQPSPSST